jgi:hypothetical protein
VLLFFPNPLLLWQVRVRAHASLASHVKQRRDRYYDNRRTDSYDQKHNFASLEFLSLLLDAPVWLEQRCIWATRVVPSWLTSYGRFNLRLDHQQLPLAGSIRIRR